MQKGSKKLFKSAALLLAFIMTVSSVYVPVIAEETAAFSSSDEIQADNKDITADEAVSDEDLQETKEEEISDQPDEADAVSDEDSQETKEEEINDQPDEADDENAPNVEELTQEPVKSNDSDNGNEMSVDSEEELNGASISYSGQSYDVSWKIYSDGLLEISGSGDWERTGGSCTPWYGYRSKIKTARVDLVDTENASGMFCDCEFLTSLDVSGFDTSKVKDISGMFAGCSDLKSLNLSNFDTSQVEYMGNMFRDCSGLTSLDLSGFNTSKVTDMSNMFAVCSSLKSLNLSNFDTSQVEYMGNMFKDCSGLTSLDLSKFNTSKVTVMSDMFAFCSNLTSLDLSKFNTSQVYSMNDMFYGCSSLTSLNLSNFDTSNVISMNSMFYDCSSLTSLNLSNFDTSNVISMNSMFYDCSSLTSLNVSSFNTSQVMDMCEMFAGCNSLTILNLSSFDTKNVEDMDRMFCSCCSLSKLNTPKNVNIKVELPDTMYDSKGEAYEVLPMGLSKSILLTREGAEEPVDPTPGETEYTVTYDLRGHGETVDSVTVESGSKVTKPADPEEEGYVFGGWYMDSSFTIIWDFNSNTVTKNITLYAKWTRISGEETDDPDEPDEPEDPEDEFDYNYGQTLYDDADYEISSVKEKVYDGKPYTPVPKVVCQYTTYDEKRDIEISNKKSLVYGKDFRVIYDNNVNAGKHTMIVLGMGNYDFNEESSYTIKPKKITSATKSINTIEVKDSSSLPIDLFDKSYRLKPDRDYEYSSLDVSSAGTKTITVKAVEGSNYEGSFNVKISVVDSGKKPVLRADDFTIDSVQYNGKAQKPTVIIASDRGITKADYSVAYKNNKDVGIAYAIISGKGKYTGKVTKAFSITAPTANLNAKLKKANVQLSFTGKAQTPAIVVTTRSPEGKTITLKNNTDYTIRYYNNVNATNEDEDEEDIAFAVIKGMGNYKGKTATVDFSINQIDIKKCSISAKYADPEFVSVKYKGIELTDVEDYEVDIDGVDDVKANVIITGTGRNFYGTVIKNNVKYPPESYD